MYSRSIQRHFMAQSEELERTTVARGNSRTPRFSLGGYRPGMQMLPARSAQILRGPPMQMPSTMNFVDPKVIHQSKLVVDK
jgi:hypothetical protein